MGLEYRIGMDVPRQREVPATAPQEPPLRGAAARTRALMVATSTEMMRRGLSPSVSDVAGAAGVSRSTANRYFPSRADMLGAVVAEALGPILDWGDDGTAGEARIASLYHTAFPRLFEHEATFRAALRQSLDPEAEDAILGRGHRRELLARATAGTNRPPTARASVATTPTCATIARRAKKVVVVSVSTGDAPPTAAAAAQSSTVPRRRRSAK